MNQPQPTDRPDPQDPENKNTPAHDVPETRGGVHDPQAIQAQQIEAFFNDDLPLFSPGRVVAHRRYGYRGVVVDFDMSCHADEAWYRSNLTQPAIDQPWYHVLVHGSTGHTYVAQENLIDDTDTGEVVHPLVCEFFNGCRSGRYDRNDMVWPT